ncbi:MAG TPA: BON domain-containing protein [Xanthobacteraceae bacterium]
MQNAPARAANGLPPKREPAAGDLWDITVSVSELPPTDMPQRIAQHMTRELAKPTGYIKAGGTMKKHVVLCGMIALGVACAPLAMADEPTGTESHHFIKDSAITTKVKAKLAAKHMSTLTRIKVDTDADGVVWLSGRAPTRDASDLAAMIAKNTEGVNSVHNDITIEP